MSAAASRQRGIENHLRIDIDLTDPARCPAFRSALGIVPKNRKHKSVYIDPEIERVLSEHVPPGQQSDVINMGVNLILIMHGWI